MNWASVVCDGLTLWLWPRAVSSLVCSGSDVFQMGYCSFVPYQQNLCLWSAGSRHTACRRRTPTPHPGTRCSPRSATRIPSTVRTTTPSGVTKEPSARCTTLSTQSWPSSFQMWVSDAVSVLAAVTPGRANGRHHTPQWWTETAHRGIWWLTQPLIRQGEGTQSPFSAAGGTLFWDYNDPIDAPQLGTEWSSEPENNSTMYVAVQVPALSHVQHTRFRRRDGDAPVSCFWPLLRHLKQTPAVFLLSSGFC